MRLHRSCQAEPPGEARKPTTSREWGRCDRRSRPPARDRASMWASRSQPAGQFSNGGIMRFDRGCLFFPPRGAAACPSRPPESPDAWVLARHVPSTY